MKIGHPWGLELCNPPCLLKFNMAASITQFFFLFYNLFFAHVYLTGSCKLRCYGKKRISHTKDGHSASGKYISSIQPI